MFLLVLVSISPFFGCGSGPGPSPTPTTSFQVVVFSDLHFNPFYDTSLFPALQSADPSQWAAIFQGSAITTPSAWDNDTNYPLLVLALSGIKQNLGSSPLILYTGDLIGHNFSQTFYQLNGNALPPDPTAVAAMQAFTDKTVAFVAAQIRANIGNIPALFAVGNIDSYTGEGPDSVFLSNNAETFYTQFLGGTADQTTFLSTFKAGGYYSAAPLGTKLLVIGLNTNPFSPLVQGNIPPNNNDAPVDAELTWLDSTLASAKASGQHVWLLMHVPPGAVTVTTASNADSNGHITVATASMMWEQNYQESFLTILSKYPGLITLTLAAHTHMDEFRILSQDIVLEEAPAISPVFGNDPAFKIFTITNDTLSPIDYRSLNYDLATLPPQFSSFYTFSSAYAMQGPLNAALQRLYPFILTSYPRQALFTGLYLSGHNYANPITSTTWPIFACGIGQMDQTDFVKCVNSF
ncbi:MAG: hypothetical protein WAM58_18240 [Candidatus Acidiferrum sp.]